MFDEDADVAIAPATVAHKANDATGYGENGIMEFGWDILAKVVPAFLVIAIIATPKPPPIPIVGSGLTIPV